MISEERIYANTHRTGIIKVCYPSSIYSIEMIAYLSGRKIQQHIISHSNYNTVTDSAIEYWYDTYYAVCGYQKAEGGGEIYYLTKVNTERKYPN